MKKRYLILFAIVGFFGLQAYYNHDSSPPGVLAPDHGKIRNRQEMIRYYERQISILHGQSRIGSRTVARTTISESSSSGGSTSTSFRSDNLTRHAKITEYYRKIAELRAEIGALQSGRR